MDEEWAQTALSLEEEGQGLPPTGENEEIEFSPLHYDPTVARLDLIADRVMAVRTAVQASYAEEHREPYFEPITKPTTAIERERDRRTLNELNELDAYLQGSGLELVALAEE